MADEEVSESVSAPENEEESTVIVADEDAVVVVNEAPEAPSEPVTVVVEAPDDGGDADDVDLDHERRITQLEMNYNTLAEELANVSVTADVAAAVAQEAAVEAAVSEEVAEITAEEVAELADDVEPEEAKTHPFFRPMSEWSIFRKDK